MRALLLEQQPDLAHLDVVELASGWDNAMFRVGSELAARLPRRAVAAPLVDNEQRWLPLLAPRLPLPIPRPLHRGLPGHAYPWAWSLVPWIAGEPAALTPPVDPMAAAIVLGNFVRALHQPAPLNAPLNPYRGVPLVDRDAASVNCIELLAETIDGGAARAAWRTALDAPRFAATPVGIHGDLHPANIVVRDGKVAGVIDFGDITAGDPATDLAAAWMLLPIEAHTTFRLAAGEIDDATWARARGWALTHALVCLANSANNPLINRVGRRTLDAVLLDA